MVPEQHQVHEIDAEIDRDEQRPDPRDRHHQHTEDHLYRSDQVREALDASINALAMHTRDASLLFHAGMIAAAAGDTALALHRLEQALEINPRWHPTQPAEARAVLNPPVGSSVRVD